MRTHTNKTKKKKKKRKKKKLTKEHTCIYASPVDTDNNGEDWGEAGAGWKGAKEVKVGEVYNTVNNIKQYSFKYN